jgi:hypothetical protein
VQSLFSREDFQRNCETTQLSIVLRQYSTYTQYRAAQSDKVRDVSKLQLLQYSLYWNRSFAALSTSKSSRIQRPQYWTYRGSLGNVYSVRSSKPEVSRQQHPSTGTTERSTFKSEYKCISKRPENLLTGLSTAFGAFKRSEHSSLLSQYLS